MAHINTITTKKPAIPPVRDTLTILFRMEMEYRDGAHVEMDIQPSLNMLKSLIVNAEVLVVLEKAGETQFTKHAKITAIMSIVTEEKESI